MHGLSRFEWFAGAARAEKRALDTDSVTGGRLSGMRGRAGSPIGAGRVTGGSRPTLQLGRRGPKPAAPGLALLEHRYGK